LVQNAEFHTSGEFTKKDSDAIGLATFVKVSRPKRLLIRAIDAVLAPLISLLNRFAESRPNRQSDVRRILVQEYWNLGDIIMELAFLRNLRVRYPAAHIVFLASPKVAALIEKQDLVDEIIVVEVPWAQHYSRWKKYNPFSPLWIELGRTLSSLRAQSFDLAFSARADLRENFILWLLNIPRRIGYSFGGGGYFLTDTVTPNPERPHFSDRWLRLLEYLGDPLLFRQPLLQLSEDDLEFADQYLAERGIGKEEFLVGIHAGARSPIRQWGRSNFADVAERLRARFPVQILWFEDPSESPLSRGTNFTHLSLPLRQFIAVLSRCRILICNDSGPMHIATALNVPVVAIFGPTEPAWFGPLGTGNRLVLQPGFWCRPCFDYCLFEKPYCLRTISPETVYKASASAVADLISKPHLGILTAQAST
jgi:ADP-heptose:LPS heptosyltransferase